MPVLHLLANPDASGACLALAKAEDALLLMGDGVLALPAVASAAARGAAPRLGVLSDDAQARAVAAPDTVQALSYDDFVAWVVACERSITWA